MRTLRLSLRVVLALAASCAVAVAGEKALDLRRGVPADVYLVVHGKRNPERDFQREYYKAIWKTVKETRIIERAAEMVTSRHSRDDVDKAKAILDEIKQAAAPIRLESLVNAKEVIYAQEMRAISDQMKVVTSQHLLLVRLTPEAAAQTQKGIKNLFGLVEKYSEGKARVDSSTEGEATIVTLGVPRQVPFQPTVVCIGDVLVVSSSEEMARKSMGMLLRGDGKSKFDDPRLEAALRHLPKPEDSLVFYDMSKQMSQIRGMVDFLQAAGQNDPKARRAAELLEVIFDEVTFLDYEVTVEYTEGNLNRTAAFGKLLPGAEMKTLHKVFAGGKPFSDWRAWVPANAVSYSLSTGANLHPLYERVIDVIKERFPEAEPGLARFEEIQSKIGVHLDRDLLQAFSGERISISLPAATPSLLGGRGSVLAMRCQKPDRIRELLHRAIGKLKEHPAVAAQQLQLAKCDELEGFEQLSALALTGFGVKPVIGFRDGWMMVGSNADAIKAVLDTKVGKAPSIADAQSFKQFHLNVDGSVQSISCKNTAEDIRQVAAVLNQAGVIVPMVIGMVGAKADPAHLKPVQELLGLLPSLGKIVSKFDFLQAQLSVTEAGPQPGTYLRRSVTVVRPPAAGQAPAKR